MGFSRTSAITATSVNRHAGCRSPISLCVGPSEVRNEQHVSAGHDMSAAGDRHKKRPDKKRGNRKKEG